MDWFADERFWRRLYPMMFPEARFAAAPKEVDQTLAIARVTGGAALDLCCGPGRHALELARRGFQVTGVDRSPFLLAKARAAPDSADVEFVQADMREFVLPLAFDLVVNLFTSFGYFDTREEDMAVLKNIRQSLKPGGVFVIDVMSKEFLASQQQTTRWTTLDGDGIYIQHFDVLPGWGRVSSQWLLIEGDRAERFCFEHNVYSGREFLDMLSRAGFTGGELFGSLAGQPYDASATRLVARAVAP